MAMSPPPLCASARSTYGPAAPAPHAAAAASAPRRMNAPRVIPWISTPARMSFERFIRSFPSPRDEGLDLALNVGGRDRSGKRALRSGRVAERLVQGGRVPALHRLDRERDREH